MSTWKLVTRRLYEIGGSASYRQIDNGTISSLDIHGALTTARLLGVITSNRKKGYGIEATYALTEMGRLWCEGKLREGRGQGTAKSCKSLGFVATWLRALPETVKLPTPWQLPLFD